MSIEEDIEMFNKVKCNAYLIKNDEYKNVMSNEEDETVIEGTEIFLGYGETCVQDKYKLKLAEFEGIIVGIYYIGTQIEFQQNYNDYYGKDEILTNLKSFRKVAKVYYKNNKSRIVPIENIELNKEENVLAELENSISKDKIREIIRDEFPEEETLYNVDIYDVNGVTIFRRLKELLEEE